MNTKLLTVVLGLLLLIGPARAANQTVTSLADSGAGSLRESLNLVGVGEIITFAVTGTIQLSIGQTEFADFGPLPVHRFYRAFKP